MDLKKGDWDNLEGRVMVYAKFVADVPTLDPVLQEHARELPFIALYFSSDAEDFKSKMGVPAEHFEHDYDIAGKAAPKIHGGLYAPLAVEDSFFDGDHDVLFIGEIRDVDNGFACLQLAGQFYMRRYLDNFGVTKGAEKPEEKVTYSSLTGDLVPYVTSTFLSPLQRAIDDLDEFEEIRKAFIDFSADASPAIGKTVEHLCDAISVGSGLELTDSYLMLIEAIHKQDFKRAAILRDRIKELMTS